MKGQCMNEKEIRLLSVQALAYIGDCVVELCVRSLLLERGLCRSRELNKEALHFVSAVAQAEAMERILPLLSEDERGVYRRAHNTGHLSNVPKSATVGQYRSATGMEALFGYLYLCGELPRIRELFRAGYRDAENAELPLLTVKIPLPEEIGSSGESND